MTKINAEEAKYKIIAYLGDDGNWEEDKLDVEKLTHLNYAFALIENGKVVGHHLKKLNLLNKAKTRNKNLKTLISIGGWGADGFSDAALSDESRKIFAQSALEFVVKNGFDGIDLDWEYPCDDQAGIVSRREDKENYTAILKLLREKLDRQGEIDNKYYFLTIALGAGVKYIDNIEMDKVKNYLDFINVMTYDMRGSFTNITGHHTNLHAFNDDENEISGDKEVKYLLDAGVPRDKIILGGAFYGRMWCEVNNIESGLNVKSDSTGCIMKDYSILVEKYINKNGFKRYWDDKAKAPYLFDGSMFISYDDEESLEYKSNYVKEQHLGGFMFWEYSLDNTRKLLDKIYSVLG